MLYLQNLVNDDWVDAYLPLGEGVNSPVYLFRIRFLLECKQKMQVPQAFAFSVATVNDEHMKPRFKRKRSG